MHWSSGLAKLTRTHTHVCTLAHACTHVHAHTDSRSLTHANFWERSFSCPHMQSSSSAAGLRSLNMGTHTRAHTCKRTSAFMMLLRCTHWHATSPAGWGSCRNVDRFDLCLYKKKTTTSFHHLSKDHSWHCFFFFFLSFILLCFFGFVLPEHGKTWAWFFRICILSCNSRLPFWRWAADKVEKAVSGSSTVNTVQFRGKKQNVFLSLEVMLQCWWLERLS